jgi:hypothetical protein
MICLNPLTDLSAQESPQQAKISLERWKLVELTKLAKKSDIFEKQNTALIRENSELKTKLKTQGEELETTQNDLGQYRRKWRYALGIIGVFVLGILYKIFKR